MEGEDNLSRVFQYLSQERRGETFRESLSIMVELRREIWEGQIREIHLYTISQIDICTLECELY